MITRTNQVTNPSFEAGLTKWGATRCTLSLDPGRWVGAGGQSVKLTSTDGTAASALLSSTNVADLIPLAGATSVAVSYSIVDALSGYTQVAWRDAAGAVLSFSAATTYPTGSASAWRRVSAVFAPPAGAVTYSFTLAAATRPVGTVAGVDAVLIEHTATVGAYFDGSTNDTSSTEYNWTGAAHASTSTAGTWGTVTVAAVTGYAARITVTVDSPGQGTMTLYRVDADGSTSPVMGASDVVTAAGVWDDPEAPLGRPVTYRLVFSAGGVLTSTPITIDSGGLPVLSDPYRGLTTQVRIVAEKRRREHASRATVVDVEGRRSPVVLWDVESGPRVPTITLLTVDAAEESLVDDLSATGDPLLLRAPCPGVPDRWIQRVGSRSVEELLETRAAPERLHVLSDVIVLPGTWRPGDRPTGDTLADLDAAVGSTTLAAIAARWSTLLEIATADLRALS